MNKIVSKIDFLLKDLPDEDAIKSRYIEKAKELANACGCSSGAAFFVVTLVIVLAYILMTSHLNLIKTGILGFLVIFCSAILGKSLAIGIARLRLFLLYKSLLKERR